KVSAMKTSDETRVPADGERPSMAARQTLIALYEKGDYRQVLEESAGLIARYPRHPFAYHLRGVALRRLHRNKEAARALERAARLAPRSDNILNSLAHTYINLRRHRDARAVLERIIALKPSDAEARFMLCRTLTALGDLPGALAQGGEAIRL